MKKKTVSTQEAPKSFPIVGIGASAGGLSAFEAFFSGMPADTDPGMAFVLVQHLAPDHKSILTELVRRYTRMQVSEVKDGMTVNPNCAYIIPPNRDMAFLNGTLQLLEPTEPHGRRFPIDFFFRSLAQDQHERAICIVLSGTGSDGTMGVRAIKDEGGMVMVQDPDSTEYDGMPRSAIDTGLVDYQLQPEGMATALIAYAAHAYGGTNGISAGRKKTTESILNKVFVLLRSHTGHDFSQYKPNTINRRIERRMAVHQIESMDEYLKFMHQTPDEIDALFRDLLIGVTGFFRDPEAFAVLEETVIPQLFNGKPAGSPVRVWIPGCSTGEEAYSIAILLQEKMESLKQSYKLQVFATDIDGNAIATARAGLYPAGITSDLTPERLARFFSAESDGVAYRIHKSIRDMLVFSEQDVIKDPPFSRLDLISCRNLLIYLSGDLQRKLIPLFHYSLNPAGTLFLGTSETISEFGDLFSVRDRKAKLFQRMEVHGIQRSYLGRYFPPIAPPGTTESYRPAGKPTVRGKLSIRELTEQAMLEQVVPSGALVNSRGDIFYLHGRTGMFLEPAPGETGVSNILKMAREGLRRDLAGSLRNAANTRETVHAHGVRVKTNGDFTLVDLTVRPIVLAETSGVDEPLFLVIMDQSPPTDELSTPTSAAGPDATYSDETERQVSALRQKLRTQEEYLQTANEELETTNEELKSSNEEMQSVNEELQSTNEELETSKEELQSVNEELATVNAELQTKVADLSRANNDMNNLLAGTGIGTVFVDHQLHILRFTPTVTRIINLIHTDIGRPVGHIVSNLIAYDNLVEDIQSVLNTLQPRDVQVRTDDKKWYTMRIQPYRTLDNVIEGAVITFIEITEARLAKETIQNLLTEKETLLKEVHHRIKNNMHMITVLLSHQAETSSDRVVVSALKEAEGRVKSMMLLYNSLYRAPHFDRISVQDYIPSLVDDIVASFQNGIPLSVEKSVDDFVLDAKRLQPLGIIINELVTNAMKYAFEGRKGGTILISVKLSGELIVVSVQDDGIGIPESVDLENGTGFGFVLVRLLTGQLDGSLLIERENGTKITVEFEK